MNKTAHLAALLTIFIWGTTFISTKILLSGFNPIEILFYRFLIGYAALLAFCPRRLPFQSLRQESLFALAGLCGVCLYYLLENIALTHTLASNVGVILSISPFFTAILSRKQSQNTRFYLGFALAICGVFLISFSGRTLQLNPVGDLLALSAAFVWACYSLLTRQISRFGLPVVLSTRRVFLYGLLFLLPALPLFRFQWNLFRFCEPVYLGNILFLGFAASALCFVTWGFAVDRLGAVQTSAYIYLVPAITMAASAAVLHERLTLISLLGAALTLAGLLFSESHPVKRKENRTNES